jgi:DNA (cytosine-5)-methyltransferase 1
MAVGLMPEFLSAIDSNRNMLEVYDRNLRPKTSYSLNLWQIIDFQVAGRGETARFVGRPMLLDPQLSQFNNQVDILLGGPPCQGYSNSNNHTRRDDPRNVLYLAMPAIAIALGVEVLIVENVPEIGHDPRLIVKSARQLLEDAGYKVSEGVINALDLGLPQRRRRHFLIAAKSRQPDLLAAIKTLRIPSRSISWALEDLVDIADPSGLDSPALLSAENRTRIQHLFENDLYEMPNSMRPLSHQNGNTYPSVYGRLRWDEPAGTITTGFMTPGRGRFIHALRPRTLTAHEAARLQSFPDSFDFRLGDNSVPPKTWLGQMIGEAVPPLMGYATGLTAIAALSQSKGAPSPSNEHADKE